VSENPVTDNNDHTPPLPPEQPEPQSQTQTPTQAPTQPQAVNGPSWFTRSRLIAAGVICGVFLGGGAVGYAVGNATADDGGRPDFSGRDFDGRGGPPDGDQGFQGGPQDGGQGFGGQAPNGRTAPGATTS